VPATWTSTVGEAPAAGNKATAIIGANSGPCKGAVNGEPVPPLIPAPPPRRLFDRSLEDRAIKARDAQLRRVREQPVPEPVFAGATR
jgi:hypothetical protein